MRTFTLTIVTILISTVVGFAQIVEISESEFWDSVHSSRNEAAKFNHRKTRIVEFLEGKKVSHSRGFINEQILPDRKRWVKYAKNGGGAETYRIEQIEIGNAKYCRKDNGEWLSKDCSDSMFSGGGSSSLTKTFTIENTNLEGKATKHIVYRRTFEDDSEKMFDQFEIWIDKLGRIVRELSTTGYSESTDVFERNLAIYLYDPKDLKIEAPIK